MPTRVNYVARPYVQERYEPNARLGDLMRVQGRDAAEAEYRQGELSAQMWSNLGNTIAQTVSGVARANEEAPKRKAEALQVQRMEEQVRGDQQQKAITPMALVQDESGTWTYDRDVLTREFQAANIADRLPGVLQGLDAFDASARQVREMKQEGLAGLAFGVTQLGNTPVAFNRAIELAVKNGFLTRQEVGPFLMQVGDDPAKIGEVVTALASSSPKFAALLKPKEPEAFTLSPGQQRFGPDGQPVASVPAATPAAPAGFILSPGQTRFGPDGKPVASLPAAPTADSLPSLQAKDVLNDAGKPVAATFNPKTGAYVEVSTGQPIKNPRPIPSMLEQMDSRKFQKAEPVLKGMAELSEKINTQQGLLAKMAGSARKVAAQANYDDDVAEYQALISMFTPMVARALGHTGVLTELDVQSVKNGFPKPGDSKTLRDRKVKRLLSIVSDLEAAGRGTEATPPMPPPVGATGAMPSYQDYLRSRAGAGR